MSLPQKRTSTGEADIISTPPRTPDIADLHNLESVLIYAESNASGNINSPRYNPQQYENKLVCLDALDYPLPPQTADVLALVATNTTRRQKTLTRHEKKMERQQAQRAEEKPVRRRYTKRKRK